MTARARAQRVGTPSPSAIIDRVRAEVADILKKKASQIDVRQPLVAQGADELDIVEINAGLIFVVPVLSDCIHARAPAICTARSATR
jgi:hypothetical protein